MQNHAVTDIAEYLCNKIDLYTLFNVRYRHVDNVQSHLTGELGLNTIRL